MAEGKTNPNLKKKLIIILAVIVGVLLIMYLLTIIIPQVYRALQPKETELVIDYNFHEADYSENIFDDAEYNELIKNGILEYDNATNSIVTITKENAAEQGEAVGVLTNMVYSIINGNSEEYNSYFSEEYFKSHEHKGEFTMQKIYDGRITFFSSETVDDKNGAYTKYIYKLKYCIYENNGTFRKDIGDSYRTQYMVITNREGSLLIDAILYDKTK